MSLNAISVFFTLSWVLLIVFAFTLFLPTISRIIHRWKIMTFVTAIVFFLTCTAFILSGISLLTGRQQEIKTASVVNERVTVDVKSVNYTDDDVLVYTKDGNTVTVPAGTNIGPQMEVRETLVHREWNFILPFYLEETEYEYLGA